MHAVKARANFTEGKIFLKLLWFVLPIMATNLLQTFYNAADMMVVSLSSEADAVGAVGVTGSFIHLVVNVFIGFSVGANVVVARHIGANDEKGTQRAIHNALILAVFFGVSGGLVGIAVSRPVMVFMGARGNLLNLAVRYTYFYFAGVPFLALTNYLMAIFRARGDSKTPLIVLALAGLANVGLNFVFVRFFHMSVEGVALATAIANFLSFIVLLIKLRKDGDFSFHRLKANKKILMEIVRIGLPAAIQGAIISISNLLIQSSIVKVNNTLCPPDSDYQPVVSGCAAGSSLSNFVYTAQNAVYQATITLTAQNIGAKKPKRVYRIAGLSCLLSVAFGLTLGTAIFLLRVPLLGLYGVSVGEVGSLQAIEFDAATTQLAFVCLPYFLCGIMEIGSGVLRGMGKSTSSMVITIVGACLLRVIWLWTVFPLIPTLETIYLSYMITWIITSASLFTCAFIALGHRIREQKREELIAEEEK